MVNQQQAVFGSVWPAMSQRAIGTAFRAKEAEGAVGVCSQGVRRRIAYSGRKYNVRVASRYYKGPELLVDLQVS